MPRRVYLLGVGIVLMALAFAVTDAALGPRPGATEANVKRIWKEMAVEDVAAILGGPGTPIQDRWEFETFLISLGGRYGNGNTGTNARAAPF